MANSLWPWACSTSARQASATGSFGTAFSTVSASRVSAFQWRPVMVAPAGMAAVLAPALGTRARKRWGARARAVGGPRPPPPPPRGGGGGAGGVGGGAGRGLGHQRRQALVRLRQADALARPQPHPRRGGLAPGVGQAGQPIVQGLRLGLGVIR